VDPSDQIPDPTRAGVVLAVAVSVVGLTFGVLARSIGISVFQACAMSLMVFTGASQFAVVSVIGGGGSAWAAFGAAALLAARNALYGPVVSRWFPPGVVRRLPIAQLVIDESTGVGAAQSDATRARRGFLVTGVGIFITWNLSTLAGSLLGEQIGDPNRWGLDAAFPASFLVLLAPHLRTVRGRWAAVLAAAVALATTPLLPAGAPILLAALVVVPVAMIGRDRTEADGGREGDRRGNADDPGNEP
jgi:4-azaleucine resistance transporter AzlC